MVQIDLPRPAPNPLTPAACCGNASADSLAYDFPLKLGEDSKQLREGASHGCGEVEALAQRYERYPVGAQLLRKVHEVSDGAREPVEPPDGDHVQPTTAGQRADLVKAWP